MTSPVPSGFDITGRLELSSQCVLRDAYDEAAFRSLLDESPRLRECSRRGETRLHSFPDLLSDVFCLLFKLRPTLVDRGGVRPAFQVNRYLIAKLAGAPHVRGLRTETTLRERAAGAATVSVARRLLGELAAADLAEENLLFELEESLDGGRDTGDQPTPVRRKSAIGHRARDAGDGGGPGSQTLAYDLQQRLEMAEALKSFRSFEELLTLTRALVGRLSSRDPTGSPPTEVYDIDLGNELSRLLPSELVSLRAPLRKKDFLRRLLARQLLTYQIAGREHSGSLVILVDVSHSMAGDKETASKALAIALAEAATGRGQPVQVVLFGHRNAPLWQIDFRDRRPHRHEIVSLAETFFGGGTDLERPIAAAIDLISNRGDGAGQIVLISDGLCEVTEEWLSRVRALKARRQIRILTALVDLEAFSDHSPMCFSDRILRWSELMGGRTVPS
jgi:uncharacterized protein with von Willebrand factor type A (vWA) domain